MSFLNAHHFASWETISNILAGKPFQIGQIGVMFLFIYLFIYLNVNRQMSPGTEISFSKFLLRQGNSEAVNSIVSSILSKLIILGEFIVACYRAGVAFHHLFIFAITGTVEIWDLT